VVVVNRSWVRWLPAIVVPAVIAGGALIAPLTASAAVDLPAKTPEQVLALVAQSPVRALSGTLEQTSQLGLPKLPTTMTGSNSEVASILELLTSSHTARVYLDGPANMRIQVMDMLAERDVVRHGTDVWLYSSKGNTVTHLALPAGSTVDASTIPGTVQTPAQATHQLLAAIEPSTQVLIGSVSIAVDSATGLPLSVTVQARGQQEAAFRLAFSELTLQTPSAGLFAFVPPPGATIKQQALPGNLPTGPAPVKVQKPTISGSGWDSVVELPASELPPTLLNSPLLAGATRVVPGGRLLSTSLVNVLLMNDGRVFAGAVPLDRLQAAAAGQ
jgi:hypothetical protein